MENGTTFVALDASQRKAVVAILRPGATESEQRELPKEPHVIRRLFQRLAPEGACEPATKPACWLRPAPADHGLRRSPSPVCPTTSGPSCCCLDAKAPAPSPRATFERANAGWRPALRTPRRRPPARRPSQRGESSPGFRGSSVASCLSLRPDHLFEAIQGSRVFSHQVDKGR